MSSDLTVTVGVPCYNCADRIAPTVEAILANGHADFELILAEGGSRDETVEVLERLAASDPRVRVVSGLPSDVSSKRNAILEHATGELVVYCDDDFVPCDDWIGAYVRAAAKWPTLLVGASFPADGNPAVAIRARTKAQVWRPTFWNKVVYWPTGAGVNYACPRALAQEVGAWDVDFHMREDADFNIRVLRAGHSIRSVPEAKGLHATLPDWDALVQKRHRYARSEIFMLRRKYGRTLHGWCSMAVFFSAWAGVLAVDVLTLRRKRVRLSWVRLIGGLAGLLGSADWAEQAAAMRRRLITS